jgi:hypothetical protein
MGEIVIYAFLSAVYPTLIAATTVMLLLPNPEQLMLGFWLGSMITSVSCGLGLVYALPGSSAAHTARHTVSPTVDLVIAALLVLAVIALNRGEDQRVRDRYAARHPHDPKKTPKWRQTLEGGNPWHTFVVGILLSFPGVWYLAALDRLTKLDYSTLATVLVVIAFCLFQLILIEAPMLAFKIWPEQTPVTIDRVKAWASKHGRLYAVRGLEAVAGLLTIRGVIGLL